MPVFGRKIAFKSNHIVNPQYVPPLMFKGKVTWNHALDSLGTATIDYEQLSYEEVLQIRQALPVGSFETIYGLKYRVESFSYDRQRYLSNDQPIDRYTVSISLQENRVLAEVDLDSITGNASFPADLVIADGQNTQAIFTQGYYDAALTYGDSSSGQEDSPDDPKTIFRLKQAVVQELREGDRQASTPPVNTYVLRDSSSNFDESGPKKMVKRAVRQDGQLILEELRTYGFAYLYKDIIADNSVLYNPNPAPFWQEIEFKRTIYNYQSVGKLVLNVQIIPPDYTGGIPRTFKFLVHPDYARFASVSEPTLSGFNVTFQTNAQYKTSSITTGWKLVRLKKEDNSRNSLFPDDPYYPHFFFKKVPYYAQTYYLLRNNRNSGNTDQPFRIEFTDYKSLPATLRQRFSDQDITPDGKVALLYPDPNYVEPLYVSAESSQSNSFTWAIDPDASLNPDQYIQGTNRNPIPRLISGEESYSQTTRIITADDRYTEYVVEYSSQDPGFDNSAEQYYFREVSGTPPEPEYRIQQYEAQQVPPGEIYRTGSSGSVLITTPQFKQYVARGGSVSSDAKTLGGALKDVRNQLRKAHIQANPGSKTLAWFYPRLRAGYHCDFGGDRIASLVKGTSWIITAVSWTLEYHGRNNALEELLTTSPGTQLQLGLDMENMQIETSPNPSANGNDSRNTDPDINVRVVSRPTTIEDVFPPLSNRRNF